MKCGRTVRPAGQAIASAVPAVTQKHGERIVSFYKLRNVVGTVLDTRGIVVYEMCKEIISYFLAVQIGFKESQPADIQAGGFDTLPQRKGLLKLRVEVKHAANPFCHPWL